VAEIRFRIYQKTQQWYDQKKWSWDASTVTSSRTRLIQTHRGDLLFLVFVYPESSSSTHFSQLDCSTKHINLSGLFKSVGSTSLPLRCITKVSYASNASTKIYVDED
jgi:hypothetical protein